jgi:hypothetical protein
MTVSGPYSGLTISQQLNTCAGQLYRINISYFYDHVSPNFYLNLYVNGLYVISFVTGNNQWSGPPQTWNTQTGTFSIPAGGQVPLAIDFLGTAGEINNFRLDKGSITAVSAV